MKPTSTKAQVIDVLKTNGLWPVPDFVVAKLVAHAEVSFADHLRKVVTPKLVGEFLTKGPEKDSPRDGGSEGGDAAPASPASRGRRP